MAEGEVRQRLAAILAADVAGYSRLMGDDEPATIAALTAYRAIFRTHIEANGGRVVDMAGDSVLSLFDSAAGAVRAAIDTQTELNDANEGLPDHRQMHFRIGVNLGDIREADDGTIYGDGVNVAARLEGLASPGGVMLSESAHLQVRRDPALTFVDAGEHVVKNITEPVRAFRVLAEGEAAPTPERSNKRWRPAILVAAAAILLAIAADAWWLTREAPPEPMVTAAGEPTTDPILAAPTGPAIAVLPFDDLSEEAGQGFFADGLTEDIITGLSRFNNLRVIARNSTFQYKGQAVDVREVGEALGVRYVLEGSVRRSGDSLRVTAQLLDARDGTHLWAENYARDLTTADIFAIQDSIMARIVGVLGDEHGVISRAGLEETGARQTGNLTAYECVLRAYGYYDVITPAEHLAVRACLEEAVALDPTYAEAWGWLSHMYQDEYKFGFNPRPEAEEPLVRAIAASQNAIQADATSQIGYQSLATGHYFAGDLEQFHIAAERAMALNPNNSQTLAYLGQMTAFAGDWDRGIAVMDKAVDLNPNHPTWYHAAYFMRHYRDGDYEAALLSAKRYNLPEFFAHHLFLAIIYAQLDRLEEARASIAELNALYPGYADAARANLERWWKDEALVVAMMDSLEKAGLFAEPEAPSRPVIAVLPFTNMSGDPEQEYFADGITEDIITELAQFPDALVIGRNTTFQYKGKAVDISLVGTELGADYLVEGSVRRSGDSVRVTTQLLRVEDGTHLWAENFDRGLTTSNIFSIQDEIAQHVAMMVADSHGLVNTTEFQSSIERMPQQISSYECVLRFYEYYRYIDFNLIGNVHECLEDVTQREPQYGLAWSYLAMIYIEEIIAGVDGGFEDPDSALAAALTAAEKGLRLAPYSARAHAFYARVRLYARGDTERVEMETREAMRLAPNDVEALLTSAEVFSHIGKHRESYDVMQRVGSLNPAYPASHNWWIGRYHLAEGNYDDTVLWLEKSGTMWWWGTLAFVAAAQCLDGDHETGQATIKEMEEMEPAYAEILIPGLDFYNKGESRAISDLVVQGLEICGAKISARQK